MTAERWRQIEELFTQALECDVTELQAFLKEACRGDDELRRELESLLACDRPDQQLINSIPTLCAIASDLDVDIAGKHVGPYRVIRLIGRGGMGAVYLGLRDDDQYQKQVAIKLLNRGMDTDFMLSRFRQERQILANLEHPFIAHIIDGGATREGLPYFVMEYVDGVPITTYGSENNLSIPERLRLFRLVCEAVQYAHQNLVVHRDIKPSNILTTKEGIPKLLDFGIAKMLNSDRRASDTLTRHEVRMLTPDYASPEQMKGVQVGTASDTYSLGAVLYELLCGRRPHEFPSASLADIERTICEVDPEKPSDRIARDSGLTPSVRKQLKRQVSGDLDNIVLSAMRKEPARRYASVAELSEDLRRHMDGLPIRAREDRWSYRAGKFVRRNRLGVAAALLVVASLVGGIVATTIQARRAERRFLLARKLAQVVVSEVEGSLSRIPGTTAARASLIQTVIRYLDTLAEDPGGDPDFQLEIANTYRSVAHVEGAPLQPNLGRSDAAFAHYERAISIYEKVFSTSPNRSQTKRRALGGLVGVNIEAGDIEARAGKAAAAKSRLQKMALLASEATALDSDALALGTWVYLYFRLGASEMREGAPDRALVHFKKALEFAIRWAPTQPGPNSRSTLRGAYANAAGAQVNTGDLKGALENYTLGLRHAEQAIRQSDSTVYERSVLSGAHKNLGDLLGHPADFNFGDRAGAIAQYRAALAIDEALSATDPEDVRARDDLANTYTDLALILLEDRAVEAFQLSTRAANIANELTSFAPRNTKYRQTLAFAELAKGETLLHLGRNREAFEVLTAALSAMKSVAAVLEDQIRAPCWITRIHRDLGATLVAQGNKSEAEQHFREALAVTEDLVGRAPTSLYVKRYRADALEALGRYFIAVGRRPEDKKQARAYIERSLEMWRDWRRRNIATPYAGVRERNAAALLASIDNL